MAFAHLVFNVVGIALFYPIPKLRNVPIRLSHKLGDLAVKNRAYALGYVLTVFFVIPLVTILITRQFDIDYSVPKPDVLEQAPLDTIPPGAQGDDLPEGTVHLQRWDAA